VIPLVGQQYQIHGIKNQINFNPNINFSNSQANNINFNGTFNQEINKLMPLNTQTIPSN